MSSSPVVIVPIVWSAPTAITKGSTAGIVIRPAWDPPALPAEVTTTSPAEPRPLRREGERVEQVRQGRVRAEREVDDPDVLVRVAGVLHDPVERHDHRTDDRVAVALSRPSPR